ncbi:ribonuclease HII [Afifella sp. IM 167]|uniref:ribonuclease HII n=1 Tax=Afifella sp. IM 167 TaxID=2033586 RepID=UPI001CCABA16
MAPEKIAPKKTTKPAFPDLKAERRLVGAGYQRIAGIDEVGRGPLAGPVVAAAVVLDFGNIPVGIADSKALTAERREALYEELLGVADVSIAYCSCATVDRINILQASLLAMTRALAALPAPADAALVDGRDVPPGIRLPCEAIIGGDASSLSIAAASIVAKVCRDRMMAACDRTFHGYELGSHKGYATPGHRAALARLGPCRLHRTSFAPVAALMPAK